METKVNTIKADISIKGLSFHFQFHVQASPIGFIGGSLDFMEEFSSISNSDFRLIDRFIHRNIE